ncbi:RDD family protein [Halocola ammonii]
MQTIDIKTTQNVTISYELGGLLDRFLAFLIDILILFAASFLLNLFVLWIFISLDSRQTAEVVQFIIAFLPVTFYTLWMETLFNGQTVGKMALRIKVVKLDGKQLNFTDYLTRWAFRFVDIWLSLGGLAAILVTSTENGQRLGGLLSNSTVVRVRPKLKVSLKDILKINTKQNYEPVYPQIREFREEDMLLIKQTVDRFDKHKNEAHRDTVRELSERMAEQLELDEMPKEPKKFLKTLIKDYIVLTR